MKVLVTGANGFLGRALCPALEGRGCEVVRLGSATCDLTCQHSLDILSAHSFEQIFHLAAWTQAGDFCLHHPGEQWIINQQINTNVLAWWRKCQPQAKLVTIGSSCVYDPSLPLIEENYLLGNPIESLFTYAMTKRVLYAGLLALNKQYGLRYLHLVPSTLFGPGYHTDGRQMHFIFDLIRKILQGKYRGTPVVLWGDGYQKRELLLAADFVRLMLRLVELTGDDIYNVGAGEEYTIRRFAQLICEKVDFECEAIQFDPQQYVGAKSKCLNIDKLKERIPDLSLTALEEGIEQTVAWFLTRPELYTEGRGR